MLTFLVSLLALLVAAKGLAAVARRFHRPAVVGELAAGLVLSHSLLGRIAPGVEQWLFPAGEHGTTMVFTVAWLGVITLLLATGIETDLGLIQRQGRAAAAVAAGGLIVPFAGGVLLGVVIPDSFVGPAGRSNLVLYLGTALGISALPVLAKILKDLGSMRRNFGQLALAVGMTDDLLGWIALGVITGLVSAGSVSVLGVLRTLLGLALFLLFAFTVGQRLVNAASRWQRRHDVPTPGAPPC